MLPPNYITNSIVWGLVLLQDGASATLTDAYVFGLGRGTGSDSRRFELWSDYQTQNSVLSNATLAASPATGLFIRMRYSNQSASFDVSQDGYSWENVVASALSFAPKHLGPGGYTAAASAALGFIPFIRYTSSSAFLQITAGGRA